MIKIHKLLFLSTPCVASCDKFEILPFPCKSYIILNFITYFCNISLDCYNVIIFLG